MDDIRIERDEAAEEYAGIKIEGCSAGWDEDGQYSVIGEATTKSAKPSKATIEIQATVYDSNNRLIGRGDACIFGFGLRQSFEISISLKGKTPIPAMVRVFPTKQD